MPQLTPIELTASEATVKAGAVLFARNCAVCHGIAALGGGGVLPDLRFSSSLRAVDFKDIVLDGALVDDGMPSFKPWLEPADIEAIRAYVISRRAELLPKK
jgi:mono/diheme cytochrome c family protein